ncbi:prolyl oligopeptidase family serine peptidase [Gordonia sp. TBRC 11910]|uniref:Prolyl oligopeptidase family serine peptidase n=1 Tax=Gordonia asplenii TaxID=2725283 RepID=A0A848KS63_9ACTN|nr:alpha/beta hydrolase fold domain-containing protein [Gordonia asplenii]NMO01270.1 prolyl oligopeptidase family serine peptidase [Gordonia asplenii]
MKRVKVAYGAAPSQFGHVYLPACTPEDYQTVPLVVLIHGGYWSTEFSLTIQTAVARSLAERGAVVWNIEYRRVGEPGGGWPNTGRDVVAALRALDGPVAAALPDDVRSRVAWRSVSVVGHSAGGMLAVWATTEIGAATQRSAITTIIAQSAPLDLTVGAGYERGSVRKLMGVDYDVAPQRYRDASPACQPVCAAQIIALHAGDDEMVPVESSRHYVDTVTERGQSAKLVVVDGERHEAFIHPASACARRTVRLLGL